MAATWAKGNDDAGSFAISSDTSVNKVRTVNWQHKLPFNDKVVDVLITAWHHACLVCL